MGLGAAAAEEPQLEQVVAVVAEQPGRAVAAVVRLQQQRVQRHQLNRQYGQPPY